MVRVWAGREAAWAGRSMWDSAGPRACGWTLEKPALLLSTGAAQGGVEVTVLAAKWHGQDRRGGRGWGKRGGQVARGQSLGVCDDGWGGSGGGGWGKSPQGAVLFDYAAILALARPVRPLDNLEPLLLLLTCTCHILPHDISSRHRAVTTRGCCERVLATADWCAGV